MSAAPISDALRLEAACFGAIDSLFTGQSLTIDEWDAALAKLVAVIRAELLEEQRRSVDFIAGLKLVEHGDVPPNEVWINVAGKRVATIENLDLVLYRPPGGAEP